MFSDQLNSLFKMNANKYVLIPGKPHLTADTVYLF